MTRQTNGPTNPDEPETPRSYDIYRFPEVIIPDIDQRERATDPLPMDIALELAAFVSQSPNPVQVDNPHDSDWQLLESADQGPGAEPFDRFWARFESARGYYADYFYVGGRWVLGAN